jgi:hypothetical protein
MLFIIQSLNQTIYSETSKNQPALGPKNMAGFARLLLERIVWQGLKKLTDIQGGPVF